MRGRNNKMDPAGGDDGAGARGGMFADLRTRQALLCGIIAVLCSFALEQTGMLRSLESYSWDARVALLARPGPSTDQIRLIVLDQNSLDWGQRENGLSWPWPRELYAVILDFCRRGGAASVAFDVLFSEPSFYGVEDDRTLGQAAAANGHLILPFFAGRETGNSTTWPAYVAERRGNLGAFNGVPGVSFPQLPKASFPVPEVASGAAGFGTVNQDPDFDGIFRHVMPLSFFDGYPALSLSLAAFLLAHPHSAIHSDPGILRLVSPDVPGAPGTTIPLDSHGQAVLTFRGPGGTYTSYSAAAVIQSELRIREGEKPALSPEELRGRHVLFGFTAPGLLDLRRAPVGGIFTGLELHATALDNMLANDFTRRVPAWAAALFTVLLGLSAAWFALRAVTIWRLGLTIALSLCLPLLFAVAAYRAAYWLPLLPPLTATGLSLGFATLLAYVTEGRQRRFLKNAFRQYLSPGVIDELIKDPGRLKLGGEKRVLSIFFSDLAGFSGFSELLSPEELTSLLNAYLSDMTDIILEEGGTVDKYEGDAIIAFWNAPHPQEDHALRAVRTALRCQRVLEERQPHYQKLVEKPLRMRIGINTGAAVVGNMGSRLRFDYTMLGDAVNLASRLEGLNKQFGTRTMISETTFIAAGNAFAGRELGRVVVMGRSEAVRVFEPMPHEEMAARAAVLDIFSQGLAAYQNGKIFEATTLFTRIAAEDPPAAAYLQRCAELIAPLPEDWTGVWKMTSK